MGGVIGLVAATLALAGLAFWALRSPRFYPRLRSPFQEAMVRASQQMVIMTAGMAALGIFMQQALLAVADFGRRMDEIRFRPPSLDKRRSPP